jgi:hypothetical protein
LLRAVRAHSARGKLSSRVLKIQRTTAPALMDGARRVGMDFRHPYSSRPRASAPKAPGWYGPELPGNGVDPPCAKGAIGTARDEGDDIAPTPGLGAAFESEPQVLTARNADDEIRELSPAFDTARGILLHDPLQNETVSALFTQMGDAVRGGAANDPSAKVGARLQEGTPLRLRGPPAQARLQGLQCGNGSSAVRGLLELLRQPFARVRVHVGLR